MDKFNDGKVRFEDMPESVQFQIMDHFFNGGTVEVYNRAGGFWDKVIKPSFLDRFIYRVV